MLDFPVSMGGYTFSQSPEEPIIVHMERFATGDDPNATPREQRIAGRSELFATSFETLERETRKQLAGALAGGGFDPAADIAAITPPAPPPAGSRPPSRACGRLRDPAGLPSNLLLG